MRYCNADVDFIDIDPFNLNLSIDLLTERLAYAESVGRLPKLLVPVHFAGQSCNMKQISILAQKYGLKIIEDASHAIGANYLERAVGSCEYSDCAVFSFHSVKIITTGEGGIVVTNNDDLAARLLILRSHGVTRDASLMQVKNPAPWYYEQLELGYNYRMTDIQAALGASQMTRLNNFVSRRAELASRYNKILSNLPLQLPAQDQDTKSSWHLYVVRLKLNEISCSHQEVFEALRSAGIGVNLHYFPVYLQPYYRSLGFREGHCPEAERYSREAITLPLYPGLSEANQDFIAETLHNILL
jgi:dTDP-4-amino-4,6-dideoxygalactose transaminase